MSNPTAQLFCSTMDTETKGTLAKAVINWRIDKFRFRQHLTTALFSGSVRMFSVGMKTSKAEWCLQMMPLHRVKSKSAGGKDEDFVSLFVSLQKLKEGEEVAATHTLRIVDEKDNVLYEPVPTSKPFVHSNAGFPSWGKIEYISHRQLFAPGKRYLQDDTLRIQAVIEFLVNTHHVDTASIPAEIGTSHLLNDLRLLYISKEAADMVLISCDNGIFPVHKCILVARSKVFLAMLTHPTAEAEDGVCRIDDLDGETVTAMLEFMYTARSTNLPAISEKLVFAADKYDLADLRAACEDQLCSSININNVARMLILSDRHNLQKLKDSSLQLTVNNMPQFAEVGGLEELRQYNSDFFLAVLTYYGLSNSLHNEPVRDDSVSVQHEKRTIT